MSKFIFSLGKIDRKLILPLIHIILFSLVFLYGTNREQNMATLFIEYLSLAIGEIMAFFISIAFKYKRVSYKKKKTAKNYLKDFSIFFIIDFIFVLTYLFFLLSLKDEETDLFREIYINDTIEIIFITIVTYYILKYKYYIHHIICIILIAILGIIIDLLLDHFPHLNIPTVINSIVYIAIDSLFYVYIKYLIEYKYYYFLDILFIVGVIDFVLYFLSMIIILLVQKINNTNTLIFEFYYYYEDFGIWKMISDFLFWLIIYGFLGGIIEFLILDKLTPNYVIISFLIARIPASIILSEDQDRWIMLVVSIFQIIFLLFYLEIFEFNFCSLNKNTKRNISQRGDNQTFSVNDDDISIKGYDVSDMIKNAEREMEEKAEEKDNSTLY